MPLTIEKYTDEWEKRWDRFVFSNSSNGTFLHTRNFLNYHPADRFEDYSLIILQGSNPVAVIPACVTGKDEEKCFFSHKGSTFGGIVIDRSKYSVTTLEELFPLLEGYLADRGFNSIIMKQTSDIFSLSDSELFDYYYYKNDYKIIDELSFYINLAVTDADIISGWSAGRRRDYKYSLKNRMEFRKLNGDGELEKFYSILCDNLARHSASPVHSLDELKEFRDARLKETVEFYGVFYESVLIAATMVFNFENRVFHTQYLAQNAKYAHLFTMNFLIYNLIKTAKDNGFESFSFGISTEEQGKKLNTGLAVFKEGFGTSFCNNRTYIKKI